LTEEQEFVPDFRKSLKELSEEWSNCTRCSLGARRLALRRCFVEGEGRPGGIMFIGEGPGFVEEGTGRPFVGPSGKLLREALSMLHIKDVSYITNIVACRSCVEKLDKDGNVMFERRPRGSKDPPDIAWEDSPPTSVHMKACAPRIYQEIYKVDPVVIVTLGAVATEFLTGKSITITKENGVPRSIHIPGATYLPSLTAKKNAWTRKTKGEVSLPVIQRQVEYLCIPTVHPAWVLRSTRESEHDLEDAAAVKMYNAVSFATEIYKRHQIESKGEFAPRGDTYVSQEEEDDQD
jgi:DNA polymerase